MGKTSFCRCAKINFRVKQSKAGKSNIFLSIIFPTTRKWNIFVWVRFFFRVIPWHSCPKWIYFIYISMYYYVFFYILILILTLHFYNFTYFIIFCTSLICVFITCSNSQGLNSSLNSNFSLQMFILEDVPSTKCTYY